MKMTSILEDHIINDPQWGYLTSVDEGGFSLSDMELDQVNYSGSMLPGVGKQVVPQ